jgi:copper chaperone CopZ
MIRRKFLQFAALSTAAGVGALEALAGTDHTTVVFSVKGFSCITCAIGLDTLLAKEKGVFSSDSTYPEGKVTVKFNPKVCSEHSIRARIAEMGFTVESSHNG